MRGLGLLVKMPSSMKTVVNYFLDACLKKITDAKEQYHIEQFDPLELEEEVDATSLVMSIGCDPSDPARVQREIVYPYMKYYWDNLRNILELL